VELLVRLATGRAVPQAGSLETLEDSLEVLETMADSLEALETMADSQETVEDLAHLDRVQETALLLLLPQLVALDHPNLDLGLDHPVPLRMLFPGFLEMITRSLLRFPRPPSCAMVRWMEDTMPTWKPTARPSTFVLLMGKEV